MRVRSSGVVKTQLATKFASVVHGLLRATDDDDSYPSHELARVVRGATYPMDLDAAIEKRDRPGYVYTYRDKRHWHCSRRRRVVSRNEHVGRRKLLNLPVSASRTLAINWAFFVKVYSHLVIEPVTADRTYGTRNSEVVGGGQAAPRPHATVDVITNFREVARAAKLDDGIL